MDLNTIRIGGVPEHFNLPIHLAIEAGDFEAAGIHPQWKDYPGGTGEMTAALRNEETDICLLLTEGILADILKGNHSKIVSGYVKTPLTWGIHTYEENTINHEDIFTRKIAISRHGSGSHLMPIVDALMRNKHINESQFITVNDLSGAIRSLNKKETEIFYWEKFTIKPYLKEGKMKRIDDFVSPWPCFSIAASNDFIRTNPELLSKTLKIIHSACAAFMTRPEAASLVSQRFDMELKDAERWFHSTEWEINGWVSNKMLEGVHYILKESGIVDKDGTIDEVIWKRNRQE